MERAGLSRRALAAPRTERGGGAFALQSTVALHGEIYARPPQMRCMHSIAILCTGGPECDPKESMAFLQNKFRCPPMLGARRT